MAGVIEFKSKRAYQFWLQEMGDRIRILDVSTTKRWSLWTGFLGNAQTYAVTYEQISTASPRSGMPGQPLAAQPLAGYCNSCGSALHLGSRFCSNCGGTVEPHTAGISSVGSVQGRTAITAVEAECAVCGFLNPLDASVCINCGTNPTHGNSSGVEKGGGSQRRSGLVLVISALGLGVIISIILAFVLPSGTSPSEGRDSSVPSTQPSAAISTPLEKPPDPAVQKAVTRKNKEADAAALRAIREEWIKNAQQDLWRQGMEMTVQARGTTLYVEYALAGQAFAFQFGETFLGKNGATLRALGFKKVYLSNGEGGWTWDLATY